LSKIRPKALRVFFFSEISSASSRTKFIYSSNPMILPSMRASLLSLLTHAVGSSNSKAAFTETDAYDRADLKNNYKSRMLDSSPQNTTSLTTEPQPSQSESVISRDRDGGPRRRNKCQDPQRSTFVDLHDFGLGFLPRLFVLLRPFNLALGICQHVPL